MLDIQERISFLNKVLGKYSISNDGVNVYFRCPKCQHKDKLKLAIKIDNEAWHCWVCGIKGRSIQSLLKKYFNDSRKDWVLRFGSVEQKKFIDEPEKQQETLDLPLGFVPLVNSPTYPDLKAVISYLSKRGIGEKEIWRYRIGATKFGKYKRRAIITSYDAEGELNYWTARAIDSETSFRYLNPKVERKDVIFNEIDINWQKELCIVEGPFDLITAGENSTCLLGSNILPSHALFHRIVENKTPIVLCLDKDVEKKSHEIAKLLFTHGVNVRILNVGNHKDIGEMTKEEFNLAKKEAKDWIPNDRLHFMIKNISSGSLL